MNGNHQTEINQKFLSTRTLHTNRYGHATKTNLNPSVYDLHEFQMQPHSPLAELLCVNSIRVNNFPFRKKNDDEEEGEMVEMRARDFRGKRKL